MSKLLGGVFRREDKTEGLMMGAMSSEMKKPNVDQFKQVIIEIGVVC